MRLNSLSRPAKNAPSPVPFFGQVSLYLPLANVRGRFSTAPKMRRWAREDAPQAKIPASPGAGFLGVALGGSEWNTTLIAKSLFAPDGPPPRHASAAVTTVFDSLHGCCHIKGCAANCAGFVSAILRAIGRQPGFSFVPWNTCHSNIIPRNPVYIEIAQNGYVRSSACLR